MGSEAFCPMRHEMKSAEAVSLKSAKRRRDLPQHLLTGSKHGFCASCDLKRSLEFIRRPIALCGSRPAFCRTEAAHSTSEVVCRGQPKSPQDFSGFDTWEEPWDNGDAAGAACRQADQVYEGAPQACFFQPPFCSSVRQPPLRKESRAHPQTSILDRDFALCQTKRLDILHKPHAKSFWNRFNRQDGYSHNFHPFISRLG